MKKLALAALLLSAVAQGQVRPAASDGHQMHLSFAHADGQQHATSAAEPVRTVSGNYRLRGAATIRPTLIWDDGRKTYLDWPEGVEAPAIFAINAAGEESLVNSFHRDGRFVIDAVYQRLLFRLDRQTAWADRQASQS